MFLRYSQLDLTKQDDRVTVRLEEKRWRVRGQVTVPEPLGRSKIRLLETFDFLRLQIKSKFPGLPNIDDPDRHGDDSLPVRLLG